MVRFNQSEKEKRPHSGQATEVGDEERLVLHFREASKFYGSGRTLVEALQPSNLEVKRGEMVAIMGPSGSGKSTLLSLAGALDNPTTGRVFYEDKDLSKISRRELARLRRNRIGYVFQELNLLPGLSAIENVALPLELEGLPLKQSRKQAMEGLERVQIAELAHRFPDNLSGGEQQRVAIARAFVGTRNLLLADEPTGALDTSTGEVVMRLLRQCCDEGKSALLVTHNAGHAAWADRVVFIKDGRIVDQSVGLESVTENAGAADAENSLG